MVLIIITVAIYFLATKLYKKFTFAFTLPVLTVTAIMICLFSFLVFLIMSIGKMEETFFQAY